MSHGSHSSHSVHTNSDSHSSSISATASDGTSIAIDYWDGIHRCYALTNANANAHTATLGGVDWSGEFSTDIPMATKDGTGSLRQLARLAVKALADTTDTTKVDNQDRQINYTRVIPGEISVSAPTIISDIIRPTTTRFLNRYQPYTLNVNITSSVPSGGTGQSVQVTKTQTIDGTASTGTSSWVSKANGIRGYTNKNGDSTYYLYIIDSLAKGIIKKETSVFPGFFAENITPFSSGINRTYSINPESCCGVTDNTMPPRGTRLTKEQANAIRKAFEDAYISQWTGPAEKTFNITGSRKVTHSNSHSST